MKNKPKPETKTEQVIILCTPEQRARWRRQAEREGRSVSNWGGRIFDDYVAAFPTPPTDEVE